MIVVLAKGKTVLGGATLIAKGDMKEIRATAQVPLYRKLGEQETQIDSIPVDVSKFARKPLKKQVRETMENFYSLAY